jgi:hypothetical protein
MEERAERTIDELREQAERFARGDAGVGEFVADLDWALPGIAQRGGRYAWQSVGMIGDALDGAAIDGLDAREALVLVKAAEVATREGDDPGSVARVHQLLATAGLARGEPPEPRPRGVARRVEPTQTPRSENVATAAPTPPEPVDPALDPEIAAMARKVAPRIALAPLRLMGLGWVVVLTLVVGVLGGLWLDGQLGTSPLLTIVGLVIGLVGAYISARKLVTESRRA